MGSIAEFRLPVSEFCLAETVAATDAAIELLRIVAYDPDHVLPFVRAHGDGETLERLDDLLAADPSVESVERIATMDESRIYRMAWVDSVETVVYVLLEEGGAILDGTTGGEQWRVRALFPDRDALSRTYDFCEEQGLTLTIDRIYELDNQRHQRFGLTTQQHETMLAAVEHGYYDVPREATLTDLAETLDISHQALSERLRRGHGNLVRYALGAGEKDGEEPSWPTDRRESLATNED